MTFGDDSDGDEQDFAQAGPSTISSRRAQAQEDDESDYSDDDDAPEAVGVSAAKQSVQDAEAERTR